MKQLGDTLTPQELKDLEDLIGHPGWRLFETLVSTEWGEAAFARKVAQAVGDPTMDPVRAVSILQQATVSRDAVVYLTKWPREQVRKAKAMAEPNVREMAIQLASGMNRGGL